MKGYVTLTDDDIGLFSKAIEAIILFRWLNCLT